MDVKPAAERVRSRYESLAIHHQDIALERRGDHHVADQHGNDVHLYGGVSIDVDDLQRTPRHRPRGLCSHGAHLT